jgi:hypothetical protein
MKLGPQMVWSSSSYMESYDINSYIDVSPGLASHGFRVIVPYLGAYGPTTFLYIGTLRYGQEAALGADIIAFMKRFNMPKAIFAGYD